MTDSDCDASRMVAPVGAASKGGTSTSASAASMTETQLAACHDQRGAHYESQEVPDIASIMATIRERVKLDCLQAKGAELRDKRPPFHPSDANSEARASKKAADIVHSEDLRYLNAHYSFPTRLNLEGISSHRPGLIGKFIVAGKRKLLRFLYDTVLRDYFAQEREYLANLVRYLNDIGQYVGARDASMFWELVRKIDVDVGRALERIERINDEQMASLHSSERRVVDALNAALGDLRTRVAGLATMGSQHHDALLTLERVVAGLESILVRAGKSAADPSIVVQPASTSIVPAIPHDPSYLILENRFRGSEQEIARRMAIYPELFAGSTQPVLDMGCGRGELLDLFRRAGIPSRGIDIDPAMVAVALDKQLCVQHGDGIELLRSLPERSLGGLVAIQVVEHLSQVQLREIIELARTRVVSGGRVVFETINPRSMLALSSNYFRDPSHVFPAHPDTLAFTISLGGLRVLETRYLAEVPAEAQLREVRAEEYMTPRWTATIDTLNRNVRMLNELLFGYQDFCVVAEVP